MARGSEKILLEIVSVAWVGFVSHFQCLNCQKNEISAKETCIQRVEKAQWGNYFPGRPTKEAEPRIPFEIKH